MVEKKEEDKQQEEIIEPDSENIENDEDNNDTQENTDTEETTEDENLEEISRKLVKKGIVEIEPKINNPYIFLHGQSNLLKDEIVSKDLDQIRNLFDDIEKKSSFVEILENAGKAKGVQIFIGSKNFLFKHSGLSMVMAPYKNNDQEIIGAIGVVGPTRLNYSKIVPLVDYTSKIIGKVID